ncbi:MAG: hypothetical protein KDD22_02355, partial [Bdellovibrionales bacterium]|nr:hypothetical protein [Bdellovibrionales bacterium]
MRNSFLRNQIAQVILFYRRFTRNFGAWLRGTLCFAIGCSFLILENSQSFDQRFHLREPKPIDPSILILNLSAQNWERITAGPR